MKYYICFLLICCYKFYIDIYDNVVYYSCANIK